ncbi:molybdopterin-dependent oxidoreductase [Chitinophagaceae bacterium MMS25-I14]
MKKWFKSPEDADIQRWINVRTVVSFTIFILLIFSVYGAWVWLYHQPKTAQGVQHPLRAVLDKNEGIFRKIFSNNHLAKTYPHSQAAKHVRVNGNIGLGNDFDTAGWRLHVVRAPGDTLSVSLSELRQLPKTEIIFDFKCIEGWSQVTHWGGIKFSDFLQKYNLTGKSSLKYVGLSTPDNAYYVGIDMPSAMHPQTLLCYEMNGQPLPMNQGFPLRLIIPVKYGIKSLKRIGTMFFSDTRPRDYWAEKGYDYYSGL